jgi:mRNA interferase MazF
MKQPGEIVLVPFPLTNLSGSKLRPVLMLCKASNRFDDWLVCMVSSQLHQAEPGFDEVVAVSDNDFAATGLKVSSVLRLSRLAVVDGRMITGSLGTIGPTRLATIRRKLSDWIGKQ